MIYKLRVRTKKSSYPINREILVANVNSAKGFKYKFFLVAKYREGTLSYERGVLLQDGGSSECVCM